MTIHSISKFEGIFKLASVMLMVWLMQGKVLAHTALAESVPGDGSTIAMSPEQLTLSFTEEVRLLKVGVTGSDNNAIDIGFTPNRDAKQLFAVALPNLPEDAYIVKWTVLGSDGHGVDGSFGFAIDANATATAAHGHDDHAANGIHDEAAQGQHDAHGTYDAAAHEQHGAGHAGNHSH